MQSLQAVFWHVISSKYCQPHFRLCTFLVQQTNIFIAYMATSYNQLIVNSPSTQRSVLLMNATVRKEREREREIHAVTV